MKSLTRYFSLFCCFALLFSVFSLSANAAEIKHEDYYIYTNVITSGGVSLGTNMHYPTDGDREPLEIAKVITGTSNMTVNLELYIANNDKTNLFSSGDIIKGCVQTIYFDGLVSNPGVANYTLSLKTVGGSVIYKDGTSESITCSILKDNSGYYYVNYNFTANKDVSQIYFQIKTNSMNNLIVDKSVNVTVKTCEPTLAVEPNENIIFGALLVNISDGSIGWLEKIWNNIVSGFSSVVDSIVNLPAKIWEFFETGITSLFVPDENYMEAFKPKWETLLSENLGAVWQVIEVTFGSWEEIQLADENNSIEFPEVTIPLPGKSSYSFGGFDVPVVPDGFEFLADSLKMVIGGICTLMFINGLRKRYDEIMGGNK